MDDLISRQAAINAIGALSDAVFKNIEKGATYPKGQWFDGMAKAESIIKDLPSARAVEVVYCKDCEYFKEIDPCFGECLHLPNGLVNDLFWYCADGERRSE